MAKYPKEEKALIKKSVVPPSFMSYIMNRKYTLALPLYRMEQEFKRLGFEISRQNLSNWIIKGANLLKPIYEQIKLSLLNETLLHADETVLEVLHEPGKELTFTAMGTPDIKSLWIRPYADALYMQRESFHRMTNRTFFIFTITHLVPLYAPAKDIRASTRPILLSQL